MRFAISDWLIGGQRAIYSLSTHKHHQIIYNELLLTALHFPRVNSSTVIRQCNLWWVILTGFLTIPLAINVDAAVDQSFKSILAYAMKHGRKYSVESIGTVVSSCPYKFDKSLANEVDNYLIGFCVNASDFMVHVSHNITVVFWCKFVFISNTFQPKYLSIYGYISWLLTVILYSIFKKPERVHFAEIDFAFTFKVKMGNLTAITKDIQLLKSRPPWTEFASSLLRRRTIRKANKFLNKIFNGPVNIAAIPGFKHLN